MVDKKNIIDAWIMIEHLSEGDIKDNDKAIFKLESPKKNDFYSYIQSNITNNKICNDINNQNSGIVLYFDVFDFIDVIAILREKYNLKPTNEELNTGKKFSFALYFDKKLNYMQDMMFFAESAYIRYFKKVPNKADFKIFEDELKEELAQLFDESSEDADKFNKAFNKVLKKFKISTDSCRIQFLKNIESDATNLHSFFIDDLENAKEISTANLNVYLYGNTKNRINLDSNNTSPNFAPNVFEDILQPKNYPLGRFPGNTKFALSLMQQVAVNLSAGYDDTTIRSVNGPPGTGKTTLLKDIFAELIVKQAYDIAKLRDRSIKGTKETIYFDNASIGVLPEIITENNIVVASSNNGAVQNIVNELPLTKEQIDQKFVEELKGADYFCSIANSKVSSKWEEDEKGKTHEKIIIESNGDTDKFWGLFSLEGGRSANMNHITANVKCVAKYLNEEYVSDSDVYAEFIEQYERVSNIRKETQKFAEKVSKYHKECIKLDQLRSSYDTKLKDKTEQFNSDFVEANRALKKIVEERKQAEHLLKENSIYLGKTRETKASVKEYVNMLQKQKPGLFSSKNKKSEYQLKINEANERFKNALDKEIYYNNEEDTLQDRIKDLTEKEAKYSAKLNAAQQDLEAWKLSCHEQISQLEQSVQQFSSVLDHNDVMSLDMAQDYDKLHLSNPWFNEYYREEQSKLFIKALKVRKQFLYENRKNVMAAAKIWETQNKYIERKNIIEAAWGWINLTIPVISSTFASFSRMCKNLGVNTIGHLFIDEAGQAVPQASVGAIFRSHNVMVVGDPSQIKPVLTMDSNILNMLREHFGVTEKYLSNSASTQTLTDCASRYGFYKEEDRSDRSWIGIPLWVHRRCLDPMFTISNRISYNGFMVQGNPGNGKTGWFDIKGKANDKYVEKQGEFLVRKIKKMIEDDPAIIDKSAKDTIYVISPFKNVAYMLSQKLKEIGFTRFDDHGKPTNVGTIHTFQGKEAPIVFMVLGADQQSAGAARWAVSEPNMMNVATTRAKKEFYIVGDKKLYLNCGGDVITETYEVISKYKKQYPELIDDDVNSVMEYNNDITRIEGVITDVKRGKRAKYAEVTGYDNKTYTIDENIFSQTINAENIISKGNHISFVIKSQGPKRTYIKDIMLIAP